MNASITYGDHLDGNQDGSRLYGIEYSTSGYGLRGHFQNLDNHEVLDMVTDRYVPLVSHLGFVRYPVLFVSV